MGLAQPWTVSDRLAVVRTPLDYFLSARNKFPKDTSSVCFITKILKTNHVQTFISSLISSPPVSACSGYGFCRFNHNVLLSKLRIGLRQKGLYVLAWQEGTGQRPAVRGTVIITIKLHLLLLSSPVR